MLSGNSACGRSSAPGSGNTFSRGGRSAGDRYLLRKPMSQSREQNRGQFAAAQEGEFVLGAPGLEELDELLARRLFVPVALAPDDMEQVIEGLLLFAVCIERDGEIEAGLVIFAIGLDGLG